MNVVGQNYLKFLIFTYFISVFVSGSAQQGWWTWMKGAATNNGAATYGSLGVPAINNTPESLYQSAACWTDSHGVLWTFGGGSGNFSSTLWKYEPLTNMWTWVNGPNTLGNGGVWGVKGIASINNIPSSRGMGIATWVDAQDNLWLFGGEGDGSGGATQGWLADLWKYDPVTNMWTWMNGPSTINQTGIYGTQGTPAAANFPSPRSECNATWVDNNGKFWLFGGETPSGMKNDLWKYDPITNEWTWMKGSSGVSNAGSYGTLGVSAAGNNPPARWAYCRWKDNSGNFWLFGGNGGINLTMNDMWRYEPATNNWTWMSGSSLKNQLPPLPAKCLASATHYPQARYENPVAWKDKCGNLWMFGGHWAASLGVPDINDVWCYKVQTNEWVFVGGNIAPVTGNQGIAAATNMPRSRYSSAAWSDNNVFWMFGGRSSIFQEFNTLWRYIPDTTCAQSTCLTSTNPTAGFTGSNLTGCASHTVAFTNTSTNATGWAWTFGDGTTSTSQNPTNTYTTPGQYTVTLIATDGVSSDTSSFTNYVTVVANAIASYTPNDDTLCIGQSVTFTNTTTNATSYSWLFGDGATDNGSNPSHTYGAAGTYTVTLYASNQYGCNDTLTSNIVVTGIQATAGPALTLGCLNAAGGFVTASSTLPATNYSWSGPGIISGSTTDSATVNAPGTYTVVVTDPASGCTNSTTIIVTSNTTIPNVTAGPPLVIGCIAGGGTISASSTTAAAIYSWAGSGIMSGINTPNPLVNAVGTYTVTVTDSINGCTSTATVNVSSNTPLPNVSGSAPLILTCNLATGTLSASSTTPAVSYFWSGTGIVSGDSTSNPTVNAPGTYTVTVTDPATGCTATATVTAAIATPPIAGVSPDITITLGATTALTASGGATYIWFPSNNLSSSTGVTTIASPIITTTYCVEITDINSCKDTACVTITVEKPCIIADELKVPNAFSPNNDGINDEFCLQGWENCIKNFTITIYDRWGEKVFESNSPNFCWDGNYLNKIMDAQVFVYYLKASFINQTKDLSKKGNISLLR